MQKITAKFDTSPQITRQTVLATQVCVPAAWTDEQVVDFVGPSGTTGGWQIRRQGDSLLAGCDERVACELREGCVHIMLDC